MNPLPNPLHERFSTLMAAGNNATEAYRTLRPFARNPHALGWKLMRRPEIRSRIDEIRSGVSEKVVLSLAQKREILRRMAEGEIPTKITKPDGTVIDMLAAVVADAKIAGEVGRKETLVGVLPFKLVFNIPHRSQADFGKCEEKQLK
jgi:hypothetical protein